MKIVPFKMDRLSGRRTLLFGLLAILLGMIVIINGAGFTKLALDLLSLYFFLVGLFNSILYFFAGKKDIPLTSEILRIIFGLFLAGLNELGNLSVNVVIIILGLYQLATAVVYAITYYLYRCDRAKGGFRYLFDAILQGLIALTTIFSPATDGRLQFLFLGIYLILLGISNIRDGLFFDLDKERKDLRRHFRVNLPVIIAAFIPFEQLERFNHFLRGTKEQELSSVYRVLKGDHQADLEVLVHTSKENLFGAIGHVDICYKGKVISYGSYDPFSQKLFGTIGDGVLFKVDKDAYIDLCKKESKKTLFGYSLALTDQEREAVEKRLREIDDLLDPWEPSDQELNGSSTYAYKLRHELGAELYKFKSSRFKSYFILSTNCCLLADSIVGQAGTAILNVRGIIAPGTYQNYLQYEFESANGLVVAHNVYC